MSEQIINITVNHTVKQVNIDVSPAAPVEIDITAMRGEEPLFLAWRNATFLTGAKQTGVDAGVWPSFSVTDDSCISSFRGAMPVLPSGKKRCYFKLKY